MTDGSGPMPGPPPPGDGPGTGAILIGCFVIAFGLCLTLVGGGCTLLLLNLVFNESSGWSEGWLLILLSLATLAGGIGLLWVGFKLMTGRYRK